MYYVVIDRQWNPQAVVGPYPTEDLGVAALESSLVIESLVEEDCLDCYLVDEVDLIRQDIYEEFVVDPDDAFFFGLTDEP